MTDVLLELVVFQLVITMIAVAVDIGVVFRGVWVPLMRSMPKEDRPYLWAGVAEYAKKAREQAELERRLKEKENARRNR